MIRKFNGWEETQAASVGGGSFAKLPAGGYEAVILNAKVDKNGNGKEFLAVMVDIAEGEFKDYYKQQFDGSTFDGKKWKGVMRYYLPVDDGSKGDNFKKSLIKAMANALESSNPRYKWDWDETKLKGKKVGMLVGEEEYDFIDDLGNSKHGFTAKIREFVPLDIIRSGEFSTPEVKYLNGTTGKSAPAPVETPAPADDDYPF